MKVILTGSTGFIGREVLDQCLLNSAITEVVALSRRQLPESVTNGNPKLKVVLMDDFTSYSEEVIAELNGASACIWSLGKAVVSDEEEARKMTLDYTLAAVNACAQIAAHDDKKFRFVYLSGKIAERDPEKSLWYMQEPRRIRGQLETKLIDFTHAHSDTFETYIMKPSMVLSKERSLMSSVSKVLIPTVRVDVLANAMVGSAINGHRQQTFENSDINKFRSH